MVDGAVCSRASPISCNTHATPACPPRARCTAPTHPYLRRSGSLAAAHNALSHSSVGLVYACVRSRSPRLSAQTHQTLQPRTVSGIRCCKSPRNSQSWSVMPPPTGAIHANQSDDLESCLVCIWRIVLASSPRSKELAVLFSPLSLYSRSEARLPESRPPHPSPSLPRT